MTKRSFLAVMLLVVPLASLPGPADAQLLMNGAGATFPYPIYSKWFEEYIKVDPEVRFNYQSIGSGGGIRQITERTVDFGASDGPMSESQIQAVNGNVVHIPTVLGAVVVTYNLPSLGDTKLKLDGNAIVDIFMGRITKWNDKRLAALNPGVNLPDHQILPVYRSDGSGTTYIWTDYLTKSSADFQSRIGKNTSVHWTVGIGQKGNEGVSGMVRNSPYSFGYVELIYALQNKMSFGVVKNPAGKFVKASPETVSAAAAGAAKAMPNDFRVSITNAPGDQSYPISSFTWLLIPTKSPDPKKGEILKEFLKWMLEKGESEATGLAYAPLPAPVAQKVQGAIGYLK